jgi:hypothetical protein
VVAGEAVADAVEVVVVGDVEEDVQERGRGHVMKMHQ